jgi:hypothetical protein
VITPSIAQARHAACAGQARQIHLASPIWRSAGTIVRRAAQGMGRTLAQSSAAVQYAVVPPYGRGAKRRTGLDSPYSGASPAPAITGSSVGLRRTGSGVVSGARALPSHTINEIGRR